MKLIKLLVVALAFTTLVSSCSENCDKTTFEEIILGTWNTTTAETVTFNADGTGTATENSVFTSELNGIMANDFTWTYDSSTMAMNVKWQFDSVGSTNVDIDVKTYECDEVLIEFILPLVLTK